MGKVKRYGKGRRMGKEGKGKMKKQKKREKGEEKGREKAWRNRREKGRGRKVQ